jgi:hypothetical protein
MIESIILGAVGGFIAFLIFVGIMEIHKRMIKNDM